ncbi:HTTM domain-containing protein [Actinoallomurus acanthiterrae]
MSEIAGTAATPWGRWWYAPMPTARIAVMRAIVYVFVPIDVLFLTSSAVVHAYLPADLYRPVLMARMLHIPAPVPWAMETLRVVLIVGSLIAATGRLPRLAGGVVAVGYLPWVLISMSYGKVDHDHLALVVALIVLPTAGRARFRDTDRSEAAGWTIQAIRIAVVSAYFLSAWAKMRWGGWGWANGETLEWALVRRGTVIGRAVADQRWLLHASQWATLVAETASPLLLFTRGRLQLAGIVFFLGFHLTTEILMSIHFLPQVICLVAAFTPWERLIEAARSRTVSAEPVTPAAPSTDSAT